MDVEASTPKHSKQDAEKHAYAVLDLEHGDDDDEVSVQRNTDLLKKEVSKSKLKSSLVRDLVKRTFKPRQLKILAGSRPDEIFLEYLHLKKGTYVSYISYTTIFQVSQFRRYYMNLI